MLWFLFFLRDWCLYGRPKSFLPISPLVLLCLGMLLFVLLVRVCFFFRGGCYILWHTMACYGILWLGLGRKGDAESETAGCGRYSVPRPRANQEQRLGHGFHREGWVACTAAERRAAQPQEDEGSMQTSPSSTLQTAYFASTKGGRPLISFVKTYTPARNTRDRSIIIHTLQNWRVHLDLFNKNYVQ